MNRILYQFPQSHFAEKGRWLLDAKELEYQTRNLYPVLNRLFLWPRTGHATIPALRDGQRWVADSTRIAEYLDHAYPDKPRLISANPAEHLAQMSINQLAERIGVLLRQIGMIYLIETPLPAQLYYQDAPILGWRRALAEIVFRQGVKILYQAYPALLPIASSELSTLLDQADAIVVKRSGQYLVGDRISIADIAMCSMVAPALAPAGTPWEIIARSRLPVGPPSMHLTLSERPLSQYILSIYRNHRHARGNWRGCW